MRVASYLGPVLGLSLALLPACRQQAPAPVVAPAGITGQLLAFDQQAAAQPLSPANVTVTVLGLVPAVTATTNADGEFALPQLPAGTYSLCFSRPGLSSFYLRGIAHPDPEQPTALPERYSLYAEPTVRATDLRATTTTGTVTFDLTLRNPQPLDVFRYALYVSDSPTLSFATARRLVQGGTGGLPAATTYPISRTFSRA
ncbi:carboxypeptidase-like regulatory domain-containing protein [Hymenobacter sp. BT559]|uniref:carboxypeptidase-like regulatory domain-containing protein n=1 Tax=Hymenobacter sp. BT559 TaxID=2795729 RepID=UPI0018EC0D75|nr:carboxypeptidase-like regulatory domain-containing protein [Hymenobacter sp. BT559]MBJ6143467.1 carboxypeptidase regulatory-like domain-containing protein [Hymenobacter sp. BT559]